MNLLIYDVGSAWLDIDLTWLRLRPIFKVVVMLSCSVNGNVSVQLENVAEIYLEQQNHTETDVERNILVVEQFLALGRLVISIFAPRAQYKVQGYFPNRLNNNWQEQVKLEESIACRVVTFGVFVAPNLTELDSNE